MTNKTKAIMAGVGGVLVFGSVGTMLKGNETKEISGSYTINQFCEKYVNDENFEKESKRKFFELSGKIARDGDVVTSLGKIIFTSSIKSEKGGGYLKIECSFDDKTDLKNIGGEYNVVLSGKFKSSLSSTLHFSNCKLIDYSLAEQTTEDTSIDIVTSIQETEPPITSVTGTETPTPIVTTSSHSGNVGNNDNTGQQNTIKYVLNTNSHKVHKPTCKDVKKIKPENYSTTTNLEWAKSHGYTACGHCKPF